MKPFQYIFRTCCLGLTLGVILSSPTGGTRVGQEGEEWLKMRPEVRQVYSAAYIRGFVGGFENGCIEGTKDIKPALRGPENEPLHKCLAQAPSLTDAGKIGETVTTFYTRYPSDRYLYIRDIIDALGRGLSVEEIHRHASPAGVASSK
jgi:hypothetical protein